MHLKMHDPPAGKRYVFNEKGQPVYMLKDGKFVPVLEDAPAAEEATPSPPPLPAPHKRKKVP